MIYKIYSHLNSIEKMQEDSIICKVYKELLSILDSIQESEIIEEFELNSGKSKSISKTMRELISKSLVKRDWEKNASMYNVGYLEKVDRFKYDFLKEHLNVEIGFLHEMGVALKIIKGSIVNNDNQDMINYSNAQVIITVTKKMRVVGGFDSSIGTFEKYLDYLKALKDHILKPLVIIGIDGLKTFKVKHNKYYSKTIGEIIKNEGVIL